MIVDPVVVKPDIVSKKASEMLWHTPVIRNGSIPMVEKTIHVTATTKNASRRLSVLPDERPIYFNINPMKNVSKDEKAKAVMSASL